MRKGWGAEVSVLLLEPSRRNGDTIQRVVHSGDIFFSTFLFCVFIGFVEEEVRSRYGELID